MTSYTPQDLLKKAFSEIQLGLFRQAFTGIFWEHFGLDARDGCEVAADVFFRLWLTGLFQMGVTSEDAQKFLHHFIDQEFQAQWEHVIAAHKPGPGEHQH